MREGGERERLRVTVRERGGGGGGGGEKGGTFMAGGKVGGNTGGAGTAVWKGRVKIQINTCVQLFCSLCDIPYS